MGALHTIGTQMGGGRNRRPPYLRRWMKEHGQQGKALAEALGMNLGQMYIRLRGEYPFSLTQARAIARYLREDYAVLFPDNDGVDPRDIRAQRVAEAGPERRHAS